MLTKTILSIGVAVALVGFAAPSVASADIWTLDGAPIGENTAEGVTFDGTGEISVTRNVSGLGKIKLGPCIIHLHGTVWNSPNTGTGHGEIDTYTITTSCEVYLNEAKLCTITTGSADNLPWTMEVRSGTTVDISSYSSSIGFSPNCPLGPGAKFSGTATGQWSNAGASISFNESGDLETPDGASILLDGSIGLTPVAGGTLALE